MELAMTTRAGIVAEEFTRIADNWPASGRWRKTNALD
jgi:hypothetical protein